MHVLILPSWYFPAGTSEIQGRMFHHLAAGLREESIEARILFATFHPKHAFSSSHSFQAEDGVPTWRVKGWTFPKINHAFIDLWAKKYVAALYAYISSEGKPDLIHAQSYLAGYVCSQFRQQTGIPYIISERLSSFQRNMIPRLHLPLIRTAFEQANLVTAVSPGLQHILQHYTDKKVTVVPNFYDKRIFFYDPAIIRNDIFTFIIAGEPSHVKGLDMLITAYTIFREKWPAIRSQLIFTDHITDRIRLQQLLKTPEDLDSVQWTGLVSQQKLASLFRESHVMLSASRVETFGKAIIEAQACGIPVIATPTEGATFILASDQQGILLASHEPEIMADAMFELYNNYPAYTPQRIVEAVESRFEKNRIIQTWKNIYQEHIS